MPLLERQCPFCTATFNPRQDLDGHIEAAHGVRRARPTWDETWLEVAQVVAKRSTCPRKAVGAVITDINNRVLGTGYNGAPAGERHCTEVGCELDEAGHCVRTIHAELNAVLNCTNGAKHGIMYVTHFPCPACVRMLVQAGIMQLVCPEPPDKPRYQRALEVLVHQNVRLVLTKE